MRTTILRHLYFVTLLQPPSHPPYPSLPLPLLLQPQPHYTHSLLFRFWLLVIVRWVYSTSSTVLLIIISSFFFLLNLYHTYPSFPLPHYPNHTPPHNPVFNFDLLLLLDGWVLLHPLYFDHCTDQTCPSLWTQASIHNHICHSVRTCLHWFAYTDL